MKKVRALAVGLAVLLSAAGIVFMFTHGRTVPVDESYNNQTVDLVKGDLLELSLPGNPSTGYSWSYLAPPNKLVLKETHQWFEDSAKLIGSGGTNHWEYLAVGPGTTTIELKYSRSWETIPPAKTFTLHVEVSSRSSRLSYYLPQ